MAPPKYKKTPESSGKVEALALAGYRDSEISEIIECAESTLKKYYAEELRKGRTLANARVISALYRQAVGGNVTACIFWAKTRLGWSDTSHIELTGKDGKELPISIVIGQKELK